MSQYYVYILQSEAADMFYIGKTENLSLRLEQHNTGFFKSSSTKIADDWIVYLTIKCRSRSQSRRIEGHIKQMKSRVYIQNLKKYPAIIERLKSKYK